MREDSGMRLRLLIKVYSLLLTYVANLTNLLRLFPHFCGTVRSIPNFLTIQNLVCLLFVA